MTKAQEGGCRWHPKKSWWLLSVVAVALGGYVDVLGWPEPVRVAQVERALDARAIDLVVDEDALASRLQIRHRRFRASDCALIEGYVGGTGRRRLLRFDTVTANLGPDHLDLGPPENNPDLFEWSECHGHYHFHGFADYRLLGPDGEVVAGHKQAFCLRDSFPYVEGDWPSQGFNCGNQGLSAGWANVYSRTLDGQWIDITGVPDGVYTLEVVINPDGVLPEANFTNNVASVPVTISTRRRPRR